MPIIKDKYEGKGSKTRSKFLTRSKNKAISEPVPTGITTQQKQELFKESYRASSKNRSQTSIKTSVEGSFQERESNINNFIVISANSVKSLFTLNKGDTLNNMLIHNFNGLSSSSTIGVYWSYGDQSNISFTVSNGVITATTGATATCLVSLPMPYLSSVDLGDVLSSLFKNVNKNIYFYVVSQVAGPSITYSMSNE